MVALSARSSFYRFAQNFSFDYVLYVLQPQRDAAD